MFVRGLESWIRKNLDGRNSYLDRNDSGMATLVLERETFVVLFVKMETTGKDEHNSQLVNKDQSELEQLSARLLRNCWCGK